MTEPNTTKIDKLLIQLLSGATDRDADTPKRREKGAARFDKAYLGIVAYVSKLEKDIAAYKESNGLLGADVKATRAVTKALTSDLKKQDKEIARLMKESKR